MHRGAWNTHFGVYFHQGVRTWHEDKAQSISFYLECQILTHYSSVIQKLTAWSCRKKMLTKLKYSLNVHFLTKMWKIWSLKWRRKKKKKSNTPSLLFLCIATCASLHITEESKKITQLRGGGATFKLSAKSHLNTSWFSKKKERKKKKYTSVCLPPFLRCRVMWNQRKTGGINGNSGGDECIIYPSTSRSIDKIITWLRRWMKTGSRWHTHAFKCVFKTQVWKGSWTCAHVFFFSFFFEVQFIMLPAVFVYL